MVGTFSPAIAPAAAAALLGAQLTASLGGILLTFDQDTNGGRLQYATTTSALSGTCPKLLDPGVIPKLGSGTVYCTWQTRRTLLITLGYNSTILPVGSAAPDAVTILPGVIANAASNSFNASGSVPLQGPETAPVPVASVVAPAAVGVCDPVTLSAAATGGGGRPLQYSYYVQVRSGRCVGTDELNGALRKRRFLCCPEKG